MGINSNAEKKGTGADLVVYGKVFTSENNKVVEAFAVKDGKYVYAGDRQGAEAFVEEGKYADFLLVNKDVLSCPENEIHTAKPEATYFEGKKVFSA